MLSPIFAHRCVRSNCCRAMSTLVALALTIPLSTPVLATEPALTLAQAQRLAVERSRALSAKDYANAASRELALAAGKLPDPVLRAGIDSLPVTGADRFSLTSDFMTMRRIGVMQEITRSDKRHWRAQRYIREADRSAAEKREVLASIERDTALAWLDLYYAEAMAAVIAEQGAQAKLEIQAAEGAYRAGRGSQADVLAAHGALASFDNQASKAEQRVRNAKTMLARWTGDEANQDLVGQPAIGSLNIDPLMMDALLLNHPQIVVMTKQEEVAQAEAKIAQANKKPDWSVELSYQQRGPAFSNMVSIGVSIPLQWDQKNRQDRELSSKLAVIEQMKAEREEALRQFMADARTMVNEWESNRERIARFDRELIPLAQQKTLASIAAYRGGKTTLSEVLSARRNEIDIRLEALQLQAETARLWAQINFIFPDSSLHANPNMNISGKFE